MYNNTSNTNSTCNYCSEKGNLILGCLCRDKNPYYHKDCLKKKLAIEYCERYLGGNIGSVEYLSCGYCKNKYKAEIDLKAGTFYSNFASRLLFYFFVLSMTCIVDVRIFIYSSIISLFYIYFAFTVHNKSIESFYKDWGIFFMFFMPLSLPFVILFTILSLPFHLFRWLVYTSAYRSVTVNITGRYWTLV
jgi:hypothetical protein